MATCKAYKAFPRERQDEHGKILALWQHQDMDDPPTVLCVWELLLQKPCLDILAAPLVDINIINSPVRGDVGNMVPRGRALTAVLGMARVLGSSWPSTMSRRRNSKIKS